MKFEPMKPAPPVTNTYFINLSQAGLIGSSGSDPLFIHLCFAQRSGSGIFLRQDQWLTVDQRPLNPDLRIVPKHGAFPFGRVVVGDLVKNFGPLTQDIKSVRKPRRNPQLPAVFRREPLTHPAAERR